MAFCTAANICGPLWAPKLFWACRGTQGGSRPELGCDPSPIAQCSLALGGISPRSWAYQCTCICACSVTKYTSHLTPKTCFVHPIAAGIGCTTAVVARPLPLISNQLISYRTPSAHGCACVRAEEMACSGRTPLMLVDQLRLALALVLITV